MDSNNDKVHEDKITTISNDTIEYGHCLKSLFLLDKTKTNFNHGSFGAVAIDVFDAHIELLREQELFPEIWFRKTIYDYNKRSRELIANMINSNIDDVVLVENASSAVNSILRSYKFEANDRVIVFSSIYKMCSDTITRLLSSLMNVTVLEVQIPYPLIDESVLINEFKKCLAEYNSDDGVIRMAIFSHISSMPTMIEPVVALIKIAKAAGITVLIDGAHAPGVINIDVKEIGADYYTGNLHKWCYCPKGSAFLWTNPQVVTEYHPQPTVISSTGQYSYVGRYDYTGTRDYTAFYALPAALNFINNKLGGLKSMQSYNRNLLKQGCDLLVREWNTSYLVPESMTAFMSNIILPIQTSEACSTLQKRLMEENNISMIYGLVTTSNNTKIFYTRISAQVYMSEEDFKVLAANVKRIILEL